MRPFFFGNFFLAFLVYLCYNKVEIFTSEEALMKLYAPAYYKHFKCIADACEHSCCVGWEIDIDERTLEKYKELKNSYAPAIMESISQKETPHFRLCADDRCPHLDERGLCKIILNVGEEYLSHICREHPRFYNFTSVAEVGVGMSCPEAARIILSSTDFSLMEEVGEVDAEADGVLFDGRAERTNVYDILQENDYASALAQVYCAYSIDLGEDDRWLSIIESLEYLNADHKELFLQYMSSRRPAGEEVKEYCKRFLAYFIYRHCTEAFDSEDFCVRLSFCLFCERLFASLICFQGAQTLQEIAMLASIISEEIEYSDDNTWALMG